jgi:hypothetical protein
MVFSLGFLFISCSNSKPDAKEAAKYNNVIIEQQILIAETIDDLDEAFYLEHELLPYYEKAVNQVNSSIKKIEELENFGKGKYLDNTFKEAALKFAFELKAVLENEYKLLIEYDALLTEEFDEELEDKLYDIYFLIDDLFSEISTSFLESQSKFAEKYGFVLED